MGLGTLLDIDIGSLPGHLNYYLLDHYDPLKNRLVLPNGALEITKERIHEIMGIPMEGVNIKELPSRGTDNHVLKEWMAQYPKKLFSSTAYLKKIKESRVDDILFRLNFIILFINTFIESKQMGTCQIKAVEKLVLLEDYSAIDWC